MLAATEWFEYPDNWEEEYRRARPGRQYLGQYALMELLRQRHGINSVTWLHLASVDDRTKRRLASGLPWEPASPRPSHRPDRTRERAAAWNSMREQMGQVFETLQLRILRAKFRGACQGEPDLFCWTPHGWFFAEAKTPGESFLPSQQKWWDIARSLDCPISDAESVEKTVVQAIRRLTRRCGPG